MGYFRYLKNQKAQIVLPAILLIPTILLAIYLLFETAKLSRFKIRSQFALDSAAFIELTSYSQFLNATAYVNGAFPFRLFRENMRLPSSIIEKEESAQGPATITHYDMFYQAGAFPAMGETDSQPKEDAGRWELKFMDANESGVGLDEGIGRPKWNTESPKIDEDTIYGINSKKLVKDYKYIWTNDAGEALFEPVILYFQVYVILGNIYDSQKSVYERLSKEGEFFRKSYYLNSTSCKMSECGRTGARTLKNYNVKMDEAYVKKLKWWYRGEYDSEPNGYLFDLTSEKTKEWAPKKKLFQFAYLNKGYRAKLKEMYTGIDIREPIVLPNNYFNINLNKYRTKLHVRAALQCTNESNNCIWPYPTPKYQVRLFP